MQYFALYTQLETMPEENADAELSVDDDGGGENSFGAKINLKSGAKTNPGKYASIPKTKRKG